MRKHCSFVPACKNGSASFPAVCATTQPSKKGNSETRTESGTLNELLARRDCLKLRLQTYHDFLASASSLTRRATRSEIRILSTIPVPEYQKKADVLSRRLREVDNAIQSANWSTELL